MSLCWQTETKKGKTYLSRNEGEGYNDHDHDEDLAKPDVRMNVSITDGGESDDDKIQRFKHGEWRFWTASLDMLNATNSETLSKKNKNEVY